LSLCADLFEFLRSLSSLSSLLTSTDGENSTSSDGRITARTDGSRGSANEGAAGLKLKWQIQQVIRAIWGKLKGFLFTGLDLDLTQVV